MSALDPVPLVALVTTDYAGITRGRAVPARRYEEDPATSVGWVPANASLTPFDVIADPNPWGSAGDLRLRPDRDARYACHVPGAATPLDMVMCDVVELDGAPWAACPRGFLGAALADLKAATGLDLVGAFEHEFALTGRASPSAPAFSLAALRRVDPLGPVLMAALAAAGLAPETVLAEYGADQFEIVVGPRTGVAIADDAVALREIAREAVRLGGRDATFSPKPSPDAVGNGVHVHLSLAGPDGRNALFDPAGPGRLSALGGSFAAGILRHMPALLAVTAPTPVSYLRLKPHNWSASYTWLGERDREASLRICPTPTLGGRDPARSFNLEYRPLDATACPHLALGMLVRAGLAGIRDGLATPPIVSGDPERMGGDERGRLGLLRLPETLEEALDALAGDPVLGEALRPAARETYLGMKRAELALTEGLDGAALCRRYAAIY